MKLMRRLFILLLILLLVFIAMGSSAQEAAASMTVAYVDGEAVLERSGEELSLVVGDALYQGDILKTGKNGMLVLRAEDGKQVQLAAESVLELSALERNEKREKTSLSLVNGNAISIIDKELGEEDSFEVETPNLVMAIRGTIASVSYDEKEEFGRVAFFEGQGRVTLKAAADVKDVAVGEFAALVDGKLKVQKFSMKDLNDNERWFLREAGNEGIFESGGDAPAIAQRVKPLLNALDGKGKASKPAPTPEPQEPDIIEDEPTQADEPAETDEPEETPQDQDAEQPDTGDEPDTDEQPDVEQPDIEQPGGDDQADTEKTPGMDEAAFQAILQEFNQAKIDYQNGTISKEQFLEIKSRYIEAKKLYYG